MLIYTLSSTDCVLIAKHAAENKRIILGEHHAQASDIYK